MKVIGDLRPGTVTETQETLLGVIANLGPLPFELSVGGKDYFLVHNSEGYSLLSRVCPHQGATVMDVGSCFECPHRGWRFDRDTGRGLNVRQSLSEIPVTERDGRLYARVPTGEIPKIVHTKRRLSIPVSIKLHAH